MANLQYLPGDPRLVDQLVYELKSKGIFDQFRKDCIADVDTRPAYQNLRQRVENSVSAFLSRQTWQPDLNKNQLREKLRKHILDGNYLEQGVERIVDQVVNPRVASVFIPQVEDLVYNYLGITRKKATTAEVSNGKTDNLLPNDLEAVSPGSVKSNDDKNQTMEIDENSSKMEIDENKSKTEFRDDSITEKDDTRLSGISELTIHDSSIIIDKENIPFPPEDIIVENIPPPENSPPKAVELEKIELPKEPSVDIPLPDEISTDIPLPDEILEKNKDHYFKPINSEDDDDSSSDSSLRRNMSPLTPIRNFNNENSCDAQQAFENDMTNSKNDEIKEPSTFRFAIEAKYPGASTDEIKIDKKDIDTKISYQFNNQININSFNTPVYEDSSNSNNLQIDYESDINSKTNTESKTVELDQTSGDSKKEKKPEERKSSHKGSHRSRDSHRHSSSKDRRSTSKQSSSKDSSRHDKSKSSKEESKSKTSDKEKPKEKSEKKDSKDSKEPSKYKSSHKSTHKDSKSHRSSSSSHRHSSKHSDDKKTASNPSSQKDKDKGSKDRPKDSKSSSHRSDKSRKSSSNSNSKSKHNDKEKDKKTKKETDDHYSLSGRGNPNRRSTDRDSNDGSSSSKGSHNPPSSKSSESKKDSKTSSKLDSTTTSGDSTSPSDKENIVHEIGMKAKELLKAKPVIRIEKNLETPVSSPPRLPFVPDITLKKPKFAANLNEAKQMMKMRKFLEEEQRRMNQEAALLLEFQANVRPSLSQVYSNISGPELEFACITNPVRHEEHVTMHNNKNNMEMVEKMSTAEELIIKEGTKPDEQNKIVIDAEINNSEPEKPFSIEYDYKTEKPSEIVDNITDLPGEEVKANNVDALEQYLKEIHNDSDNINESEINNEYKEDDIICDISNKNNDNIEKIPNEMNENKFNINELDTNKSSNSNNSDEQQVDFSKAEDDLNNPYLNQDNNTINIQSTDNTSEDRKRTEFFEVTIITEELSESEENVDDVKESKVTELDKHSIEVNEEYTSEIDYENIKQEAQDENTELNYFAEHEKYTAELERARFSSYYKEICDKYLSTNKIYLINCDTYEESIFQDISKDFGGYDVVNYHRNGHLKLPKPIVKNINLSTEVTLPIDSIHGSSDSESVDTLFSPQKSECSFDLSSDYDAKLEDMVINASRKQIMEIILGNAIESQDEMPKIDYLTEACIDEGYSMKRKISEVETTVNNNTQVLSPNKIRILSNDHISSTTEESEDRLTQRVVNNTRSKYLGKPGRVGLPRPRRTNILNSPLSDKSVENYEQNSTTQPLNGRIKSTRSKVQRYDTSDLYKPKLHYLSRRNNIT